MKEDEIKDIHSFKKLKDELQNADTAIKVISRASPLLRFLGLGKVKQNFKKELSDLSEIKKDLQKIAQLPDDFNNLFAERGWIIFEQMSSEVAERAVKIAHEESADKAEEFLVEIHDEEYIRFHLTAMKAIRAFRPRIRLLELAFQDYLDQRYHACVPVVLAQIDGLVNDLSQRSWSANSTKLEAWDSISAHSKGLEAIKNLFMTGRNQTRTEAIRVPYRNGIMHGTDLGYDSKIVAAKSWSLLFALRDWAMKAERNTLKPPPEEAAPTLKQSLNEIAKTISSYKELKQKGERMSHWAPRKVGSESEFYKKGTPEVKLNTYLDLWKKKNYGYMSKCISPYIGGGNISPAEVSERFRDELLKSYSITEIKDEAPGVSIVSVKLWTDMQGEEREVEVAYRLVCVDSKGNIEFREEPGVSWSIVNWDQITTL
jgi:hypothetical protein